MKKIIFILCSLFLISLPIFSQAQRKANRDTEHWRYELQPAVGQAPHGWVEIYSDGRTYVCDPDLQHEMPSYNWYMQTYATSPTVYHSW